MEVREEGMEVLKYVYQTSQARHTHPSKKWRIRREGVKNYRVKNRPIFILVGHTRERVPFKLTK